MEILTCIIGVGIILFLLGFVGGLLDAVFGSFTDSFTDARLKMFILGAMMLMAGLIPAMIINDGINRKECEGLGGSYMSMYRSSSQCIRNGLIIKVY